MADATSPTRSLAVGLAVSLFCGAAFLVIALAALDGERLPAIDVSIAQDMKGFAADHPAGRPYAVAFTHAGGIPAMIALALVGSVWQFYRGRRWLAAAWLAIALVGGLVTLVLKTSLDRPRPPAAWRDPAVTETNESFPSGHSMGSAIGFGMLAYALCLENGRRWKKVLTVFTLACLVLLVGFSRVYLRAHWFSDVLGGFAIGSAWLGLWLGVLESRRRARPTSTL